MNAQRSVSKLIQLNLTKKCRYFSGIDAKKQQQSIDDQNGDENVPDSFKKFKIKQAFFQKDDNVPIHLKCGLRDKILYYMTLLLAAFGLTNTFGFIYFSAFKTKTE
jgi:Cytochrome c oxidase subunit VII